MTDIIPLLPRGNACKRGVLTVLALQFSLLHGSGNGGPLVQVSSRGPNERQLSVINVPVCEHKHLSGETAEVSTAGPLLG